MRKTVAHMTSRRRTLKTMVPARLKIGSPIEQQYGPLRGLPREKLVFPFASVFDIFIVFRFILPTALFVFIAEPPTVEISVLQNLQTTVFFALRHLAKLSLLTSNRWIK